MQDDTKKLLRECNLGCKMAVNSLQQILEFVKDPDFMDLIEKSIAQHEKMEEESSQKLSAMGVDEKEPGTMTSAFSWFSTEMKLMMKERDGEAAKIIMDGCNMGIKSIGENKNHFQEADEDAQKMASELIRMEEELMKAVEKYL